MRETLFKVIKELEGFSDPERVKEAAILQDELREAQQMVTRIRESAADATVTQHGLATASEMTDTPAHTLRDLVLGFGR